MRLQNKVALITGSGSGIGRATATLFAKEGARVVVVDLAKDMGEETVEIIRRNRGEALYMHADVSKSEDVKRIMEKGAQEFGRLDILFNNAGINLRAPLLEMTEEQWDRMLNVNLKSVFLGCKYAIPIMAKQGGGVIINAASTFAFVGLAWFSAYCASKGGVAALTKAVALEAAPHKIRVNCVCPGTTETPMIHQLWKASGKPEEMRESRLSMHPIGRLGKPDDVAYAALYLASDDASFLTGSALFVDGGYTAQ
jgi:NAD(P)-dependent dehydrogenase (short-subunit alcohol dehydrogenase family)